MPSWVHHPASAIALNARPADGIPKLNSDWQTKSAGLVKARTNATAMVQEAADHAKDLYQAFDNELRKKNLISPENEMLTSIRHPLASITKEAVSE